MTLAINSVFISYRKDDSGGWAAKLARDLRAIIGNDAVFLDDSTSIPYGTQWPDGISVALDQCRVFLPVIAPSWHREPNLSRLKEHDDWVRKELITAHSRRSSVLCIPVFVNEAFVFDFEQFSADFELYTAIVSLMKQQGLKLDRSLEYWPDKIDGLISRIEGHLGVDIAHQFESSEQVTTETGGGIGLHRWLNFRQGMMALIGVAIAATALWFQLQPKLDAIVPSNEMTLDTPVFSEGGVAEVALEFSETNSKLFRQNGTAFAQIMGSVKVTNIRPYPVEVSVLRTEYEAGSLSSSSLYGYYNGNGMTITGPEIIWNQTIELNNKFTFPTFGGNKWLSIQPNSELVLGTQYLIEVPDGQVDTFSIRSFLLVRALNEPAQFQPTEKRIVTSGFITPHRENSITFGDELKVVVGGGK